jgi:hypothetical protein
LQRKVYDSGVLTQTLNSCHRQFTDFINPPTRSQQLTLLSAPAGCQALYTSPITVNYNGNGSFTALSIYYLCDEALLLENLRVASVAVGPGKSLADKVALTQASNASGDIQGACDKLTDYVNQVKAQNGKKIPAATAAALIAQANAIKAEIGC